MDNDNDADELNENENDGVKGNKRKTKHDIDDIESIPDVNIDEEFDAFDLEEFKKKYLNRNKHLHIRGREELEFEDEFDINPDELAQEKLKY